MLSRFERLDVPVNYQGQLAGSLSEPCPSDSRADGDWFVLVEPVASTKPKFPMTENSRTYTTYTVLRDRPLTLPCPAQAFPVPAFRYAKNFLFRLVASSYLGQKEKERERESLNVHH